ncbi:hypothetical protein JD844_016050 [Phrynosoma platyrhinos]|uniref:Uncharacterized protein n=1 Tax=Phrynosoma platyrhinos TaxID=52577 RepID=A0ABQ7SJZ5_PHRPL|nr:hypothetical protein JD844_016050 [Phrynosoma platyrhinos]
MMSKRLAGNSTQDVSHREAELLKIQREVQQTINAMKEKENGVHIWESQLQQQVQQCQDMEQKLTESRSELCEETEKLKQALMELADEDKYLQNKMAEDCGHPTRENGII